MSKFVIVYLIIIDSIRNSFLMTIRNTHNTFIDLPRGQNTDVCITYLIGCCSKTKLDMNVMTAHYLSTYSSHCNFHQMETCL